MYLKRICLIAFLIGALGSVTPGAVHAGAFDQLVGAAGGSVPNVPDVPDPSPVYDNSGSSGGSSGGSTEPNNIDRFWQRFWNGDPRDQDPVYQQQQREKRQKAREARAKNRRDAARRRRYDREDREWEEQQKRKKEWASVQGYVPPPRQPRATPPSLRPPTVDVPAGTEAKALTENQFRLAALLKKGNLTDKEQELARQLHEACRVLYARAIANGNLTAKERNRIKIEVPVVDFADSEVAADLDSQLQALKAEFNAARTSPSVDLIKKYNREKFQQLAGMAVGEVAENIVEGGQNTVENMGTAGKISVAIARGDVPAAGKEALDFLIGRLSSPQAGFAVEGGRMYASVVFRAMDDFMIKAMSATGKEFNTAEFWRLVKNEMTVGQKTVLEFVGGHEGK